MSDNRVDNNSEDLKSLSNDTIRKRLVEEFGFDCGPITQSTRSVYLKKLIKLINDRHEESNETNHQNNSNNDLNTNNEEFNGSADKSSSVRSTLRTPSQRNSPRRKLEEEFGSTSTVSKTSTPKTRRQSSNLMSSQKKTPNARTTARKSLSVMSGVSGITSSHTNSQSSVLSNYSSESSENEEISEELLSKIRKSPRKKVSTPPSRALQDQLSSSQRVPFARPYPPPPLTPMTNASKLTHFSSLTRPPLRRSTLASAHPSAKLANYSDSEADTEQEQNDNIRERLLRHRPSLNISSITTTSKPSQSSTTVGFEDSNNFSSASNLISYIILVLVVLFFVFIFSFYFYTRISSSPKTSVDLTNFHFIDEELIAPICQLDINNEFPTGDKSDNCLKYKSDIMPALTIVKEIMTFIDETLLKYYCGPIHKKSSIISDPKSFKISEIKKL